MIGILPADGSIIWSYDYPATPGGLERRATIITNSPIFKGDEIFISKGYDMYGVLLKVAPDGKSVSEKWRTEVLDTHHGHYILEDGYIYGSNWLSNSKGNWVCVNWETGETNWENEWHNKGSIITADNMLYLYEEKRGNVALVEPSTDSLKIVSSFTIEDGEGPHWAHPAIYDGKLFVRHGEILMIYELKE